MSDETPSFRVGIVGCTGRMGLALLAAASVSKEARLAGGSVRQGGAGAKSLLARHGFGQLDPDTDVNALAAKSQALIDFTSPKSSIEVARAAAKAGIPHICGTTGFTPEEKNAVIAAAETIPLVLATNFSVGVAVLNALVEQAARLLPVHDIEIMEIHHRHKKDAPSGTALSLGVAVARGRDIMLRDVMTTNREGAREPGSIGFSSLRGGEVVGDHTVMIAGPGERLELTHRAANRMIYADGAIKAAVWASWQQQGVYSMRDVLGL